LESARNIVPRVRGCNAFLQVRSGNLMLASDVHGRYRMPHQRFGV